MAPTRILVPVRYPLTERGVRTVSRAVELAEQYPNAHLCILHVNLIQRGEDVTPRRLRRAVEREFGPLDDVSYTVRAAFVLEEAILDEVSQQGIDVVVIGRSMKGRLRRRLAALLDTSVDLETFLTERMGADVVVAR